jgi:hypothetical protein
MRYIEAWLEAVLLVLGGMLVGAGIVMAIVEAWPIALMLLVFAALRVYVGRRAERG